MDSKQQTQSTPIIDRMLFLMSAVGLAVLVSLAGEVNAFGDVAITIEAAAATISVLPQ